MAAPSPTPSPYPSKLGLKLVIDKIAKKVLFAEAGKESVDFLCNILILPVGTVIRLLSKQGTAVGSLSNIYKSIESLDVAYIQPNQKKNTVLNPFPSISFSSNFSVLKSITHAPKKEKVMEFYLCGHSSDHIYYVSEKYGTPCRSCSCNYPMNSLVRLMEGSEAGEVAGGGSGGGGFVKGMVTYMVMDDLVVVPLTTNTLLNMFNVTDVGRLEEKVVDLNLNKALKLLEMSLKSKDVLTKVFL